jgi:hypothetical protein
MSPRAAIVLTALAAVSSCGRSETGVRISLHLGDLQYDELRFRVTGPSETLVDPESNGRFVAPFRPGDQSVVVLLSDALGGATIHCEASALRGGAVVGNGAGAVTVQRDSIRDVEIVMLAGAAPGGMTPPPPGRANGESCSVGTECLAGHCSDGVCCESACEDACHSCAAADSKGLCRPVPAGTPDPRAKCEDKGARECKTNGLCGVAGECALYPAGTVCEPPTCTGKGDEVVPARTCDGNEHCLDQPKVKCPDPTVCIGGLCS